MIADVISCPDAGDKLAKAEELGLIALLDDDERHLHFEGGGSPDCYLFRRKPKLNESNIRQLSWIEFVQLIESAAAKRRGTV